MASDTLVTVLIVILLIINAVWHSSNLHWHKYLLKASKELRDDQDKMWNSQFTKTYRTIVQIQNNKPEGDFDNEKR